MSRSSAIGAIVRALACALVLACTARVAAQDGGARAGNGASDADADAGLALPASEADAGGAEVPAQASDPAPSSYPAPDNYAAPPVQEEPQSLEGLPGAREHEGLFVRLSIGPGAARSHYRERVDGVRLSDVQASGLSGSADLAVGGRAVGNLIVHGNLAFVRFHAQTRRVDGVKDAALQVNTTALLFGAGATYYFMPYNVFLSGVLGAGWLFEQRRGGEVRSRTGFSLMASAGKEWWVGPRGQWGLGTALRFTFAVAPVEIGADSGTIKLGDLSLAFSATYN